MNQYAYVGGNPASKADPNGHESPIVNDPKAIAELSKRAGQNLQPVIKALNHPAVQGFLFIFLSTAGGAEAGATEGGGEAGAAEAGASGGGAAGAARGVEEGVGAGTARGAEGAATSEAAGAATPKEIPAGPSAPAHFGPTARD